MPSFSVILRLKPTSDLEMYRIYCNNWKELQCVFDFPSHKKEKHPPHPFFYPSWCLVRCLVWCSVRNINPSKTVRMFGVRNNPSSCLDVRCTEHQDACMLPTSAKMTFDSAKEVREEMPLAKSTFKDVL